MKHDKTSLRRIARRAALTLAAVTLVYFVPVGISYVTLTWGEAQASDWRTARRDSAGIAPSVARDEAGIHAYCARAFRWRGAFGVHCWLATKPTGEEHWTRFEVTGWRVMRGGQAVSVARGVPDGYWYGNAPTLIREVRGGEDVDTLIERLHAASRAYPHKDEYRIWPGPNSNTYVAYLGRAVPELSLDLPPTAIGKDYLPQAGVIAHAPSGSGMQVSIAGLAGVLIAPQEGLELNVLGLTAGIDVWPPALKLPGIGRIGFPSQSRPDDALTAHAAQ
ncbi:MAG: DUF3750 domain-containing protein [Azoarcus sp.]|nr:DUF3750 domain-containing protein [Azoarcus sp.]